MLEEKNKCSILWGAEHYSWNALISDLVFLVCVVFIFAILLLFFLGNSLDFHSENQSI